MKQLPPKEQWLFPGDMMNQVVTVKGSKWNRRFTALLRDRLTFSKPYEFDILTPLVTFQILTPLRCAPYLIGLIIAEMGFCNDRRQRMP